jgi:GDP-L-fucose synthase
MTEDMLHAGLPPPDYATYGMAKRMLEILSRSYRTQYGCNFVTLLPTNIYGPGLLRPGKIFFVL